MRNRAACILFVAICLVASFVVTASNAIGEDPPPEVPRIAMCSPLFVAPGATSKVMLRGWKIESATEVRCENPQIAIRILSKGTATIPNKQDAKQIGDQQVEIEVTVPDNTEPTTVNLSVVTPASTSLPHALLIGSQHPMITEQEPNDGFRQAQSIQLPQTIDSQIHADGNVDVFALKVDQATHVIIAVTARQLGSGLDSILTLYDSRFNIVSANDDHADGADSHLDVTLQPGPYFIALQDAHDHGGPAHPYRLTVSFAPAER